MAYQAWAAPFLPSVDDAAVSYTNSTTLTAVNPGAAANPPWVPGASLKQGMVLGLEAWGTISTSGTTPTILMGFYFGGTAGVILAASTAVTLTNQAAVAWPWRTTRASSCSRIRRCPTTRRSTTTFSRWTLAAW